MSISKHEEKIRVDRPEKEKKFRLAIAMALIPIRSALRTASKYVGQFRHKKHQETKAKEIYHNTKAHAHLCHCLALP